MSDLTNAEYFAARARQERELSQSASDPRAAAAHAVLADEYEALACDFGTRTPTFHVASPHPADLPQGD